jgi:hypothetical protein
LKRAWTTEIILGSRCCKILCTMNALTPTLITPFIMAEESASEKIMIGSDTITLTSPNYFSK